ncbi:MAG TPA: methyltransferase domain-containing protein [Solirubrobacteraceae bacterium]|jgi:trans-aconitate 2-methyltransferase
MGWDATTYDVLSDPHVKWAEAVLERLPLRGDETVLDAGCGSGRVTELLVDRLPRGRVIAVDGDANMVAKARERLGGRAEVAQQDLLELRVEEPVDAIFSNAVFHWVPDHERLFARLHAALRPGGRLVAQCGGHGNIAKVREISGPGPWLYATGEETEARLRAAGFREARAWLEPWPVVPPEPRAFLATVCLRTIPDAERDAMVERVIANLGDPPTLDYVRLNVDATA